MRSDPLAAQRASLSYTALTGLNFLISFKPHILGISVSPPTENQRKKARGWCKRESGNRHVSVPVSRGWANLPTLRCSFFARRAAL